MKKATQCVTYTTTFNVNFLQYERKIRQKSTAQILILSQCFLIKSFRQSCAFQFKIDFSPKKHN